MSFPKVMIARMIMTAALMLHVTTDARVSTLQQLIMCFLTDHTTVVTVQQDLLKMTQNVKVSNQGIHWDGL